jgi:hypothetical protein
MLALQFYVFAVLAFIAGAFHVYLGSTGSGDTAFTVGAGLFFFVGMLSLAVGHAFRRAGRWATPAETHQSEKPRP